MKIVILPGWGHDAQTWREIVGKWGGKANAITLPGFGGQEPPESDWGVPEYAKWVSSRIGKKEGVVILGHSFGGRVGVEIASQKPNWLRALVISGAPCIKRPTISAKLKIEIYKSLKPFAADSFKKYFFSKDLKESQKMKMEGIFRKVVGYDQTEQLQKILVPTLLIWGEEDRDVPLRIGEEMNNLIANSELKIIDNAGHNVFLEKPELFFGYANNFIKKVK